MTDMTNMSHPYDALTPDRVIDCVESVGLLSDARIFPLNLSLIHI